MIQIIRNITGDEAPTAVTLLTLTRADTGVAFPSSAWSDTGGVFSVSGTSWSISFTAPAAGLTYSYTYRRTWSDGSHSDGAGTITDYAASYVGRYTTETSLRLFLGTMNATAILDGDGDGLSDPGAAQQAIQAGEARLDFYAAGGLGKVPFEFTTDAAGSVAATMIARWAIRLSAVEAYEKRPLGMQSNATFDKIEKDTLAEIKLYRDAENLMPGLVAADPATDEPGGIVSVPINFGQGVACDENAAPVGRWGF